MRHVDDSIDLAVSTLVIVFMLIVGIWSHFHIRSIYTQTVFEKTAPTIEMDATVPERIYSAKDLLLGLVVNDELRPEPGVVNLYDSAGHALTINYNQAWFADKEARINEAWDEFFKDCINDTHSTWIPRFNTNGTLTHWDVLIYTP